MFKVSLYGCSSNGFGYLSTMDIKDINFEQLSSDNVSIVIIEDKIMSMKRYILSVNTRADIVQNEFAKGFYKAVTMNGSFGKKNWTQVISYTDAEIFHISTIHILKIVDMLRQYCIEGQPFWFMNEKVKDYATLNGLSCFTNVTL